MAHTAAQPPFSSEELAPLPAKDFWYPCVEQGFPRSYVALDDTPHTRLGSWGAVVRRETIRNELKPLADGAERDRLDNLITRRDMIQTYLTADRFRDFSSLNQLVTNCLEVEAEYGHLEDVVRDIALARETAMSQLYRDVAAMVTSTSACVTFDPEELWVGVGQWPAHGRRERYAKLLGFHMGSFVYSTDPESLRQAGGRPLPMPVFAGRSGKPGILSRTQHTDGLYIRQLNA